MLGTRFRIDDQENNFLFFGFGDDGRDLVSPSTSVDPTTVSAASKLTRGTLLGVSLFASSMPPAAEGGGGGAAEFLSSASKLT